MGLRVNIVLFLVLGLWCVGSSSEEAADPLCETAMCKCDPIKQCRKKMEITPDDCNEESPGLTCLTKVTKYEECKNKTRNETTVLYRLHVGLELADKVLCQYVEMHNEYKNKRHCWYKAVQCSQFLAFERHLANKQFCYGRKLVMDLCKNMDYMASDCLELHVKFLDALYDATGCNRYPIIQ